MREVSGPSFTCHHQPRGDVSQVVYAGPLHLCLGFISVWVWLPAHYKGNSLAHLDRSPHDKVLVNQT
ncbi:hypothetical protein E2C01_027124 [Portunus trituberculatus]|uniref:Uncharacterized protein n=1 Tax=Portunus trituberculatus TaxID=210409 RepID=A0A5B7EL48_PORTR|nr:hypothetical protein [Portunus trituberculatus]